MKKQKKNNIVAFFPEIEKEHELALGAETKYGDWCHNAMSWVEFLGDFLQSVDVSRFVFATYFASAKKHALLAVLSAIRRHHIQAAMDTRQLIEAGSWAAYALANPDLSKLRIENPDKTINVTQTQKRARDKWLKEKYGSSSEALAKQHRLIDESAAHSNMMYAYQHFRPDLKAGRFETPFFDYENEKVIKSDLWLVANVIRGVLFLFEQINVKQKSIVLKSDFKERFNVLATENDRLKEEFFKMGHFKDYDKR